jgi:UDP-2,3-diacylglucosamine pyrophosphatase LpxH
MVDAVEARIMFKSAFINHYKNERERSESCIGDIIDILQTRDTSSDDQTVEILERIIRHYSRS